MSTVYIETTIIGYLTSWPQRDLVVAARQQLTREWWNGSRLGFDVYVSQAVLAEIAAGDPIAAAEEAGPMINDPIVQEVRQARERLLSDAGGDLKTLMDHLRQMELQHPERIVTASDLRGLRDKIRQRPAGR